MKIEVVKTLSGLKVAYNSDYENFKKIPLNEVFEFVYKKKRNIKFHKKFFALLNLYYENQNDYTNLDDLRKDLLIVSGYYEEKTNFITGEIYKVAKSLSFPNMDEVEFSKVYEDLKNTICKLLSVTSEQVTEEIEQHMRR